MVFDNKERPQNFFLVDGSRKAKLHLTKERFKQFSTTSQKPEDCRASTNLDSSIVCPGVLLDSHGIFILPSRLLQPRLQGLLVPVHLGLHLLQLLRLLEDVVLQQHSETCIPHQRLVRLESPSRFCSKTREQARVSLFASQLYTSCSACRFRSIFERKQARKIIWGHLAKVQ